MNTVAGIYVPQRRAPGFIIPWVLIFIAVFSAISLIALNAARDGVAASAALRAQFEGERNLFSAEQRLIYQYLTAEPSELGILLADTDEGIAQTPSITDRIARPVTDENRHRFWSGRGGIRRDANGVMIQYQDALGLVSLTGALPREIAIILTALGVDQEEADRLVARLGDYQDQDRSRRFLGAEAQDYRRFRLPEPSNSPLRRLDELDQVMGWPAALNRIGRERLYNLVTVDRRLTGAIPKFLHPELAQLQALTDYFAQLRGRFDIAINQRSANPSDTARFTLSTSVRGLDGPVRLQHIIEIERRANSSDRPFTRTLILTRTIDGELANSNPVAPLIPARP